MSTERFDIRHAPAPRESFRLLYISKSKFGGDWNSTAHTHSCTELFYCLSGEGQFLLSGPLFPGTIDMNGVTVINQMHDVLSELIADGFTKIVVMNAHFENEAFIVEAIDLVTRETGGVATIVETNWWDPVPQSVIDKVFDGLVFPGWALEHAAVTETSLMLHYAPELVHMDRMVEEAGATAKSYVRYPVRQGDVPAHGGLANPAGSSAERGRLIAEACVGAVAEICAEEFGE